jgi:hypothetical protein
MLEVLLGLRRDISTSAFPLEFGDELSGDAHVPMIGEFAAPASNNLDRFLQFLGNPKRDLLYLDHLTGRRVPSHPGRPLPHLEDAETGQADFVALLEVPGRQRSPACLFGRSWLSDNPRLNRTHAGPCGSPGEGQRTKRSGRR